MGRDESAEAMWRNAMPRWRRSAAASSDLVTDVRCCTVAIRRGHFERASQLLAESLALYRSLESKFDSAGSLAQQGFLALRQDDPARASGSVAVACPSGATRVQLTLNYDRAVTLLERLP